MLSIKARKLLKALKLHKKDEVITKTQMVNDLWLYYGINVDKRDIRHLLKEIKNSDEDIIIVTCEHGYFVTDDVNKKVAELDELISKLDKQKKILREEKKRILERYS